MIELLGFISYIITLYTYIVIASVILSWLMAFGIVNPYNPTVRAIDRALSALTEPLLRPIRAIMPNLGAVDISPLVLLLCCFFIQSVVLPNIAKLFV
jgi:YggT family protein